MHYYQFNIGDYHSHTGYLSLLEDLAYRRLLDTYYLSESPITGSPKQVARVIGMRDNVEEVTQILEDFFILKDGAWVNKRVDSEIELYHSKAVTARNNGRKGGRPPKDKETQEEPNPNPEITQSVNLANPEITGSKANHKPITNNHKPIIDICQLVTDEYNLKLSELGKVKILSDKRKSHIRASIKQFKNSGHDFAKIETWTRLFDYVTESDFLMGRSEKSDWIASFDFIINKANLLKIVEGQYDNKQPSA